MLPTKKEEVDKTAWTIANALIESGRASSPVPVRGYLCLKAEKAGYYWVANDAKRILFGLNLDSAIDIRTKTHLDDC